MKVKSARGETLDVGKFLAENGDQVALGNAKMNARGDILGANGQVVKKREAISAEYHRANPKAAKKVALKNLSSEVFAAAQSPQEALDDLKAEGLRQQAVREAQEAAETVVEAPTRKRKISDSE